MDKRTRKDFESTEQAALRLLQRLTARKYRAAGNGQAAPIHDRLSKSQAMRRLGLSEEKNRRQSPQRVADNDNGRKGPREKQTQNLLPRSRDKLPCRREWEERHGWGMRAVGVVVVAINAEMRPTAPKAESYLNGFTMPVLNSNALWGKDQ